MEVSRRLGVTADMVRTWRRRFLERGPDGLSDEPRPGVPRKITDADVERVIVKTLDKRRNEVERTINRLKNFRAVATRYDKRAPIFHGTVTVAAIWLWLRL